MEFLGLKTTWLFTPEIQIILIVALFVITTWIQYREFKKTGKMYGKYPEGWAILFAPIYEEIIFRGFLLSYFIALWSVPVAVIVSSILFGIWHFKNIFWEGEKTVIKQMLYTSIVFGPTAALVTIWTGTIWLAVILHYAHNLVAAMLTKKTVKA